MGTSLMTGGLPGGTAILRSRPAAWWKPVAGMKILAHRILDLDPGWIDDDAAVVDTAAGRTGDGVGTVRMPQTAEVVSLRSARARNQA